MELARQAKQREVGAGLLKMLGPEGVEAEDFDIGAFAGGLVEADPFTQRLGQSLLQQQFKPAGAMSATEKRFLEQAKMPGLRLQIEATGDKIKATPVVNVEEIERLKRQYDSLVSRYNIAAGNTGLYWGEGNTWDNQLTKDINQKLDVAKTELALRKGDIDIEKGKLGLTESQQKLEQNLISEYQKTNKQTMDDYRALDKAFMFVEEARKGNPTAAKNLVAAVSRVGSPEALSDNELNIMLSGNVSEKADAWLEKYFKGGSTIGPQDVENAIAQLNSLRPDLLKNLNKSLDFGVKVLMQVNPSMSENDARRRLGGSLADEKGMTKADIMKKYGKTK
jgi:hypothetical protein